MTLEANDSPSHEQHLHEILEAYLQAVEAGQRPDRQELLARHPDLAGELAAFFADHDKLNRLAEPLRAATRPGPNEAGPAGGQTGDYSPVEEPTLASPEAGADGERTGADAPTEAQTLGPGETTAMAPPVGTKVRYIGDYELLEELGRGGMGVVYKAQQTKLKRLVALKMILAGEYAGAQELARFRSEGEAVARLQHPNIVQIFEVGEHEGHPYFSLEYCVGGSLEKKLQGTPLPPKAAAQLLETLARAMHAAHQAGVIHRDLKPANVLLTGDGTPKITDFGLAKKLGEAAGQTASGAIMGTPSYMAPEQAGGQSKDIGPAADVYALGAILYELLTGRPPFKAATPLDTVRQVVSDEPVPPRQLQPRIPRDLETISLKCLQKDARKRYPSAETLADDLGRFLAGKPIAARPVGRIERVGKWVRRRPALAALAAVCLLAGLALLGGGVWFTGKLHQERNVAQRERDNASRRAEAEARAKEAALAAQEKTQEARERAEMEKDRAEKARRQAEGEQARAEAALRQVQEEKRQTEQQLLRAEMARYAIQIGLAQREWQENNIARARAILNDCDEHLRGWEHAYLRRLCDGQLTLKGHQGNVFGVAFSPDGTRLATASADRTVKVWEAATGREVLTLKGNTVQHVMMTLRRNFLVGWG